jgi:hypothetical protein
MATRIDQLKDALIKAHTAGDTEAAQLFADEIKGIQSPVEAGVTDARGIPEFLPPQEALAFKEKQTAERGQLAKRKADAGFFNKITGALEVPAALATGTYGSLYGATKGLLPERFGGTNLPFEQSVAKEAQRFMYQPRTVSGQEYLPKTLDVIQQSGIEGLPALSQVSALSRLRPVPGMPIMQTPQMVSNAQQTISNIGANIPTPGKYLQGKARDLMQSALKPTAKQQKTGQADVAVQTLLENNMNVTKNSVDAMKNKISSLNEQIASKLEPATGTVSKVDVVKYLDSLRAKKAKQANPASDLAAIDKVAEEFMQYNKPLIETPTQAIPVQLAQELKQGTYSGLQGKYGQLGSTEIQAQKTLARGLKEKIAGEVENIGALNKAESKLLDTLSVTERRIMMDLNKDPISLGWLSNNPAATVGFMATRSPKFKSILANVLYRVGGGQTAKPSGLISIPGLNPAQKAGAVGLLTPNEQGQ